MGVPFYDLDDLIMANNNGRFDSVRSMYTNKGQDFFMAAETAALSEFINEYSAAGGKGAVLSLGGGTVENTAAVEQLKNTGTRIYIKAPANILYNRIIRKGIPPFLSQENPAEDFEKLYAKRDRLYLQFADIVYKTTPRPPETNATNIMRILENQNAG